MTSTLVKGNGLTLDYLHFSGNGFSCKLVPAMGGSMQELIIGNNNLIWGCSPDKAGLNTYREFCNGGWLFPFPNRVEDGRYTFRESEYQLERNDKDNGHAIHGLVCNELFRVIELDANSAVLRYQFTGNEGYPFQFDFTLHYRFLIDQIQIDVMVENTGGFPMPLGIGWHPYFNYSSVEGCNLRTDVSAKYTMSSRMIPQHADPYRSDKIPVTPGQLDDVFEVSGRSVYFDTGKSSLHLESDFGNFLQLYAPAHRNALAIEPMSCLGNAFNNEVGLQILDAGGQTGWSVTLKIS